MTIAEIGQEGQVYISKWRRATSTHGTRVHRRGVFLYGLGRTMRHIRVGIYLMEWIWWGVSERGGDWGSLQDLVIQHDCGRGICCMCDYI